MARIWRKELPKEGDHPRCLVTQQIVGGDKGRRVTLGWVNTDRMQSQALAWMPLPPHIRIAPSEWRSPYRGDDEPLKSDWYLVCQERARRVDKLWYDTKQCKWFAQNLKYGDVIAWMPLPKPYKGVKQ